MGPTDEGEEEVLILAVALLPSVFTLLLSALFLHP
jgi:hypothetical protein